MSDFAFTAAACKLAKAIFHSRIRAYDLALVDWDELDVPTRHLYVQQAGDILRANAPISSQPTPTPLFDAFVAQTRREFQVITNEHRTR